jgi:putative peptidoglycan lipid II flippase
MAGAGALLVLLRRRIGGVEGRQTAITVAKIVTASAAVAIVAFAVWKPLDDALGRTFVAQLASLAAALLASGLAYLAVCWGLRVRELHTLLALRAHLRRL